MGLRHKFAEITCLVANTEYSAGFLLCRCLCVCPSVGVFVCVRV